MKMTKVTVAAVLASVFAIAGGCEDKPAESKNAAGGAGAAMKEAAGKAGEAAKGAVEKGAEAVKSALTSDTVQKMFDDAKGAANKAIESAGTLPEAAKKAAEPAVTAVKDAIAAAEKKIGEFKGADNTKLAGLLEEGKKLVSAIGEKTKALTDAVAAAAKK